jgi:hypothetical protein
MDPFILQLGVLGVAALVGTGGAVFLVAKFLIKRVEVPIDAYTSEKMKNLATHQDIQKLVDQVRETERVRAEQTRAVWDYQTSWAYRKDTYVKTLESLIDMELKVEVLTESLQRGADDGAAEVLTKARQDYYQSLRSFTHVVRVSGIALSKDAESLLKKFMHDDFPKDKISELDFCKLQQETLGQCILALKGFAQKDLGLRDSSPSPTGGNR